MIEVFFIFDFIMYINPFINLLNNIYSRTLQMPATYRLYGEQKAVYSNSEFKNLCDISIYIDLY